MTVNIESRACNIDGETHETIKWQVRAVYDNHITISIDYFAAYEEAVVYACEKYPNAHFKIEGLG